MGDIDRASLKSFILEASRATYASGDKSIQHKQPDGSTTIQYESGPYRYHDSYFGGEPYGGREVIFLNGKPLWIMVYYGSIQGGVKSEEVYTFLIEALSNSGLEAPYRGPSVHERGSWRYESKLVGEVENFSGTERIFKDGACVYEARYLGGLVDQA